MPTHYGSTPPKPQRRKSSAPLGPDDTVAEGASLYDAIMDLDPDELDSLMAAIGQVKQGPEPLSDEDMKAAQLRLKMKRIKALAAEAAARFKL